MKQQSQENEKVLNSQIEIIKNQYKNQVEEEMKKIRKSLIKNIANNFDKSKKNFEDKYIRIQICFLLYNNNQNLNHINHIEFHLMILQSNYRYIL